MVATGSSDAIAERRAGSTVGARTCLKPAGTVCNILMGYVPLADLLCLVYNQAAIVRTMRTKAFLRTLRKNKSRAAFCKNLEAAKKKYRAYRDVDILPLILGKSNELHINRRGREDPMRRQVWSVPALSKY